MDEGWRTLWWYYLWWDPNLASIRDAPEFQEATNRIEADMALQLERIRQLEFSGELELPPAMEGSVD